MVGGKNDVFLLHFLIFVFSHRFYFGNIFFIFSSFSNYKRALFSLSLICKSPKINSCSQIISHWIHRPIEKHFGKHCKEETIWLVSGNVSSIFSIENSSKYLENASPNYWHLTGCPALNKLFSKYLGSGILIACTLSYWVNICSILINLSE